MATSSRTETLRRILTDPAPYCSGSYSESLETQTVEELCGEPDGPGPDYQPGRYLLAEFDSDDSYYLSTYDGLADLLNGHLNQECPYYWGIHAVFDLDTGEQVGDIVGAVIAERLAADAEVAP